MNNFELIKWFENLFIENSMKIENLILYKYS